MHKLFRSHYRYLYSGHKIFINSHNSLLLISQLHSFPKTLCPNSTLDYALHEVEALNSSALTNQIVQPSSKFSEQCGESRHAQGNELSIQISHPWPEWVDLMELLLKRGYFEANGNPYLNGDLGTKETNWIRTACLNFSRDQFGLIRFLSRKDIHIITGCGCPSIDRKVVNSGKRLRAHIGIDEGNVCSSCNSRGDCERAYVKAREDEGGRTVDVMRILLTYGLDSISSTSGSGPSQSKIVKESVRRLLKEMVEFSSQQIHSGFPNATPLKSANLQDHKDVPMKQGDWLCPRCNFLNFSRNIRCLRCDGLFQDRLKHLLEDQNHLPLKKGDWICEKCNFLNFAKNTRCLQCKEKPPKRHLNPGEWECESCNYINFRRNMVCLKCDHRRPKALNAPNNILQSEHDNRGYAKHSRLRSVHSENGTNDDTSIGMDRTNQRSTANMWRFVEEEREDDHSNLRNEESRFVDFPIAGGKSSLSQNAEKRERWKLEMLKRRTRGCDEELRYAETLTRSNNIETTDDEDMAEWFGLANKNGIN